MACSNCLPKLGCVSTAQAAPPRWSPWSAPLALLLGITLALVLGSVVFVVSDAVAGRGNTPGANLVATTLQDACFIVAAVILAATRGRPSPEQFGLRAPKSLGRAVAWAGGGYVAFVLFAGLWLQLINESSKDKTLNDLGVNHSTAALIASMLVVCVSAPIAEEFLFRGYIFTALRNWAGPLGAAATTGLLFGLIHLDPDRPVAFLVPLAVLGFLLCVVYWKTGSLYPCIALHTVNNAIAFGATEGWSWQIPLLVVGALGVVATILLAVHRLARPAAAPA
jgi:membrane protease YdiL (CAAX protease family)